MVCELVVENIDGGVEIMEKEKNMFGCSFYARIKL